MGHEYITYKSEHVLLDDFDLWMLRHFLLQSSSDPQFVAFVNNIEWVGPGVYLGTNLYDYTEDIDVRIGILISALENSKKRLASFGDTIPLDYLENNVNLERAYCKAEQPVQKHCENIVKIIHCNTNSQNG